MNRTRQRELDLARRALGLNHLRLRHIARILKTDARQQVREKARQRREARKLNGRRR